jgi:hypothetical protein
MTYVLQPDECQMPASAIRTLGFPFKRWRSKMKTLIAALALLSLAAGSAFAQTTIQTPRPGHHLVIPNSPGPHYVVNPNSMCSTLPAFCDGYHGSN